MSMFSYGPISLTAISSLLKWWIVPSAPVARLVIVPCRPRYLTVIPIERSGAVGAYRAIAISPWLKG